MQTIKHKCHLCTVGHVFIVMYSGVTWIMRWSMWLVWYIESQRVALRTSALLHWYQRALLISNPWSEWSVISSFSVCATSSLSFVYLNSLPSTYLFAIHWRITVALWDSAPSIPPLISGNVEYKALSIIGIACQEAVNPGRHCWRVPCPFISSFAYFWPPSKVPLILLVNLTNLATPSSST